MTALISDAALDVLLLAEPEGSLLSDLATEVRRLRGGCQWAAIPGQVRAAGRALARRLASAQAEIAVLRAVATAARAVLADAEAQYPPERWPLPQAALVAVDTRPLLTLKEALAGLVD